MFERRVSRRCRHLQHSSSYTSKHATFRHHPLVQYPRYTNPALDLKIKDDVALVFHAPQSFPKMLRGLFLNEADQPAIRRCPFQTSARYLSRPALHPSGSLCRRPNLNQDRGRQLAAQRWTFAISHGPAGEGHISHGYPRTGYALIEPRSRILPQWLVSDMPASPHRRTLRAPAHRSPLPAPRSGCCIVHWLSAAGRVHRTSLRE